MPSGSAERGFTYLAMLLAVAVVGIGLAAAGELWSTAAQREREQELLFAGGQFRRAIRLYFHSSPDQRTPGAAYPKTLRDLLEDRRRGDTKRHLRRLYADPLTGKPEWGLVTVKGPDGDRIMGVYSLSKLTPFKTSGFRQENRAFEGAKHFREWQFLYEPQPAAQSQSAKR